MATFDDENIIVYVIIVDVDHMKCRKWQNIALLRWNKPIIVAYCIYTQVSYTLGLGLNGNRYNHDITHIKL